MSEDRRIFLSDRLAAYRSGNHISFHMPGHKRNGDFGYLVGKEIDITEIDGFDNLHCAKGVIADSERRAAELFGVKSLRFSVGGGTTGILAGMRALTSSGDRILAALNCHKSVFNAAQLMRLDVELIAPACERYFAGEIRPSDVDARLTELKDVRAVVITSPTYEGIISDVQGIAEVCHKHGAKLLVDEAHGSHLGLYGVFGESARTLGADIVVNSLHKTLPSLTQTAVISVCGDIDEVRLDESLGMFETSSPSYILMSSIDGCVGYLASNGRKRLEEWKGRLEKFRSREFEGVKLYKYDGRYDISKLVFMPENMSGTELMMRLNERGIELEMAGADYVVAMSGMGTSDADLDALYTALNEIGKLHKNDVYHSDLHYKALISQKYVEAYVADEMPCEAIRFEDALGRIAAENVVAYPPASPIIFKGREVTKEAIEFIISIRARGVEIQSAYDGKVKVIL